MITDYPFSGTIPAMPVILDSPIANVLDAICAHFHVTIEQLKSESRKQPLTTARQWAVFFLREVACITWTAIGKELGNRDHTTGIHAYRRIHELIGMYPDCQDTHYILQCMINDRARSK